MNVRGPGWRHAVDIGTAIWKIIPSVPDKNTSVSHTSLHSQSPTTLVSEGNAKEFFSGMDVSVDWVFYLFVFLEENIHLSFLFSWSEKCTPPETAPMKISQILLLIKLCTICFPVQLYEVILPPSSTLYNKNTELQKF